MFSARAMFPAISALEGGLGAYMLLGSSSIGYIMLRTGWPKFRLLETEYKTGWGIITGSLFAVSTIGIAFAASIFLQNRISLFEVLFIAPTCTVFSGLLIFSVKRRLIGGRKVKVSVPKRVVAASIIARKAFDKMPIGSFEKDSDILAFANIGRIEEEKPQGVVIETRETLTDKFGEKKITAKPVQLPDIKKIPQNQAPKAVKLNPMLELPAPSEKIGAEKTPLQKMQWEPTKKKGIFSGIIGIFGAHNREEKKTAPAEQAQQRAKPAPVQKPVLQQQPQKPEKQQEKISVEMNTPKGGLLDIRKKLAMMGEPVGKIPEQKKEMWLDNLNEPLKSDVQAPEEKRAQEILTKVEQTRQSRDNEFVTRDRMTAEVEGSKRFILENLREKLGMKPSQQKQPAAFGSARTLPKSANVLRQILQESKVKA